MCSGGETGQTSADNGDVRFHATKTRRGLAPGDGPRALGGLFRGGAFVGARDVLALEGTEELGGSRGALDFPGDHELDLIALDLEGLGLGVDIGAFVDEEDIRPELGVGAGLEVELKDAADIILALPFAREGAFESGLGSGGFGGGFSGDSRGNNRESESEESEEGTEFHRRKDEGIRTPTVQQHPSGVKIKNEKAGGDLRIKILAAECP